MARLHDAPGHMDHFGAERDPVVDGGPPRNEQRIERRRNVAQVDAEYVTQESRPTMQDHHPDGLAGADVVPSLLAPGET